MAIFTRRNEVVAKVMFLLVSVILSTGGPASVHAGRPPRAKETTLPRRPPCQGRSPPRRPPAKETPPRSRLRHTVNERSVRILLECILVVLINWTSQLQD